MSPDTQVGHTEFDTTDVYIGRHEHGSLNIRTTQPGESWGNPYKLDDHSRGTSVRKFAGLLETLIEERPVYRLHLYRLHGKVLGCYCRTLDDSEPACHGDILAAHADGIAEQIDNGERCERGEHRMVAYRSWHECAICGVSGQTLSDGGRPYDVVGDGAVDLLGGGSS